MKGDPDITTIEQINNRGQELTDLINKSEIPFDSATVYALVATAVSVVSASSPDIATYRNGIMELARMLGDWSSDVMEQRFGPGVAELSHVIEATSTTTRH